MALAKIKVDEKNCYFLAKSGNQRVVNSFPNEGTMKPTPWTDVRDMTEDEIAEFKACLYTAVEFMNDLKYVPLSEAGLDEA